jgi:hypothetical protein
MMITPSGITINFGGTPGNGDDNRSVIARIAGFAYGDERAVSCEMVVPAGQSVEQELPRGLYNVQLTLPSGRLIQRNVTIEDGNFETYQFFEDFAPGAGFSLQESVGRTDRDILETAASASGNISSSIADAPRPRGIGRRARNFSSKSLGDGANRPLERRTTLQLWSGQVDVANNAPPEGPNVARLEPVVRHGDSALWRIESNVLLPADGDTRRWARVALPSGVIELASLPLPWFSGKDCLFSAAEVLVDPARSEGASTTVAVRDAALSGLLSFLDRGQASSAGPMLQQLEDDDVIEQTISSKMSNPLAACAAAYVGLAVYPPGARERWDEWLGNCMTRYPAVPDAAIVHARRMLLRPTSISENSRAADALRLAFASGVPFFSAGVLLLREMLLLLSADHADLKPLADKAGVAAGRVDTSQVFTVLRFAGPRENGVR